MQKQSENIKKDEARKYWIAAGLGSIASFLVYTAVKVVRGEKPTLRGGLLSSLAGGVSTPIAIRTTPKLIEMLKQTPTDYSFRPVATPSYRQVSTHAPPGQVTTPQAAKPTPSPPAAPTAQGTSETNHKRHTWFDVLPEGSVALIIGKPGSGKSALGYLLLEKLQHRGSCYVVNLPKKVHHLLPRGIGVVANLENAPFNAALLLDEAALQFPARMSATEKNQRLLEVISLARQRNQTIIFMCQEASYVDINILRGLSTLIIKEPAPLQVLVDRPELKEFIQRAQRKFETVDEDKRASAYIAFSPPGYEGMVKTAKPPFFSEDLSRCYACPHEETKEKEAQILSKGEKKKKTYQWHTEGHLSVRQIANRLGVSKSTVWNWIQEEKEKTERIDESIKTFLAQLGQIRERLSKAGIK